MKFHATPLAGLFVIEAEPRIDERGRFERWFCAAEFTAVRPGVVFTQVNHSVTRYRGTVRGLHFQRPPAAEAKLVRCLRGRLLDVAVDLRAGSPTFGHWHGIELDDAQGRAAWVPEGFAHGFQALTDEVEMLYHVTAAYVPALEGGLRHDDPALAIDWPLPVTLISDRDRQHPLLGADFEALRLKAA